jgi:hypothetical protein
VTPIPNPQSPTPDLEPLVCVHVAQGQMQAHVFKARLESEGIPVLLKYESLGVVYGFTLDGLGEVCLMVPAAWAEEALRLLAEPVPLDEDTWTETLDATEPPTS